MCHDHAHNANYICHMSIMAINFVMIMYITLPLWHHQNDAALKRAMIYDRSPQQAQRERERGGGGRETETDRDGDRQRELTFIVETNSAGTDIKRN